ncbi:MAG TPA: PIG-L family deacetylase [Planctomycetota bacterium]
MALHQAVKDAAADALVLLVASHPDDRYVLPAVWLRSTYGMRVAVLLATRGGGGQNSMGPETGDGLERIRTLETEAGCAQFEGEVWYLNCPDGGYRRSAEETFAEWGRDKTLRDIVCLLRTIRPDAVVTTHHREELHGHDQALVSLLPEAIRCAGDASFDAPGAPCAVRVFLLGAGSTISPNTLRIDADRLDQTRGATLRRIAYEVLRRWHTSPGPPGPIDTVFESELKFESQLGTVTLDERRPMGLPSVLDAGTWPGSRERAAAIETFLTRDLPSRIAQRDPPTAEISAVVTELRELLAARPAAPTEPDAVASRLRRRIAALEKVLLLLAGVQIELDVRRGLMAVAGEEFVVRVLVHTAMPQSVQLRAEGLDGVSVDLATANGRDAEAQSGYRADATIRVPLDTRHEDPMMHRFRGDRFVPPVRIQFFVRVFELEVPVVVTVPVEQRSAVELDIKPRMLLLPSGRHTLQFSVSVACHTQFPVDAWLEVKAPAGYAILQDRQHVLLQDQRGDLFEFAVSAPAERKPGVDVLRVRLGDNKVALPVHKIDVRTPASLRVGLVGTHDDTLAGILGAGGLGLAWSELSDTDIAVANLRTFDTIVVDIRALRDRPEARRGFRRLLEFARDKGKRLVVFYHKDVEFDPPGEGFLGAPFQFHVGKTRVTRADAPVRILKPDHVLLVHPNPILPSDWDGWVQERALYLPSAYASEFEEILEMQDPGQAPERSALLYARTGEGEYVYCALALWRQLKKLHPGAVRILANLLSPTPRS